MLWQVSPLFFGAHHDEMSDILASLLNVVCPAGTSSAAPASRVFRSLFLWESQKDSVGYATENSDQKLDLRHLLLQSDSDGQTILHLAAMVGKKDPLLLVTLLDYNRFEGYWYFSGMVDYEARKNYYHGLLGEIFGNVEMAVSCHIMMSVDNNGRTASDICGLMKYDNGVNILDQYRFSLALNSWSGEVSNRAAIPTAAECVVFFSQFAEMKVLKTQAHTGYFGGWCTSSMWCVVRNSLRECCLEPLVFVCDSLGSEIPYAMIEEYLLIDTLPKCEKNKCIERMNLREFEKDILQIWDGVCTFLSFLKTTVIKHASKQVRTAVHRNTFATEEARKQDRKRVFEDRKYSSVRWQWKMMQITDDTESVVHALREVYNNVERNHERRDQEWKGIEAECGHMITDLEESDLFKSRGQDLFARKREVLSWLLQVCIHGHT